MEQKGPSKASKWLDTLAPILAGAAAVLGYKKDSAGGDVLMGIGKGYADHLTESAKAKRDQKISSDNKLVDLAHKYLSEIHGDVDEGKYPRLAEKARNLREGLTSEKLANPKDALELIAEYNMFKEDVRKLREDQEIEKKKRESMVPFQAFTEGMQGAGASPDVSLSALLQEKGGITEDPERPGSYIPTNELANRARLKASGNRDVATGERARLDREQRAKDAAAGRGTRASIAKTYEEGRDRRHKEKLKAAPGTSSKEFTSAYKAATTHARALDKNRPMSDPKQIDIDTRDYLSNAGHPPTKNVQGKTYYWHAGKGWSTTSPVGGGLAMTPPPFEDEEDDFGFEEDPYEGE
jgi:hypothetical protein